MNPLPQDELGALLRKQFEGPVPDDGFTDQLMRRLPHHRRRAAWPLWAGVMAGTATAWAALLPSPLLQLALRDSVQGNWSAASVSLTLVTLVMVLLASAWAVLETDTR